MCIKYYLSRSMSSREKCLITILIVLLIVFSTVCISYAVCYDVLTKSNRFRSKQTVYVPIDTQPRSMGIFGALERSYAHSHDVDEIEEYNIYYAALMYRYFEGDQFVCNAYVLKEEWFLTTGHCGRLVTTYKLNQKWFVKAGMYNLYDDSFTSPIAAVLTHHEGNLTLLRTKRSFNSIKRNLGIPIREDDLKKDAVGSVIGWGKAAYESNQVNEELENVKVFVTEGETCLRKLRMFDEETNGLCTVRRRGSLGGCMLAEGAILEVENMAVAMVSNGEKCAEHLIPVVFIDLRHFKHWIDVNINS